MFWGRSLPFSRLLACSGPCLLDPPSHSEVFLFITFGSFFLSVGAWGGAALQEAGRQKPLPDKGRVNQELQGGAGLAGGQEEPSLPALDLDPS